jgi:hypothetical protein
MYDMAVIPVSFTTAEKKNMLLNLKELGDPNVVAIDLDRHPRFILALRTDSSIPMGIVFFKRLSSCKGSTKAYIQQ